MPLFTRESAGEAISLEISWHTGKIHESRLKLVHDVGPSSPLSDRPDYDRCKDHPYPAPGPGVGRAFLPADLRQVSRRHHKRTAQAGRPHPSARALTQELGLARGTIDTAYSLLAAEGYIQARGQAGTIVTPGLKPRTLAASAPPPSTSGIAAAGFRPDSILPFQMGLPALDAFPRKIWARLARAACVPCRRPRWCIPRSTACRRCGPRLPPTCMCRAGSTARRRRSS
jgi:hypothetical protein